MNFLVPGLVSAVVGAVLSIGVVLGVTAAVEQNSRPDVDRSANAGSSLLNQVEYGNR